jgi:hypothetical protein
MSAAESGGGAAKNGGTGARERWDRLSRTQRVAAGALTTAAAFVGLLVGILTVIDRITDNPPPQIDAGINKVELIEKNVALGDYLRSSSQSTEGFAPEHLAQVGNVFFISVHIEGQQGKPLPLRWSMFDADTERALSGRVFNQIGTYFRPRSPSHAGGARLWVPLPGRPGRFFIRAVLENEAGQHLDEKSSPTFEVVG